MKKALTIKLTILAVLVFGFTGCFLPDNHIVFNITGVTGTTGVIVVDYYVENDGSNDVYNMILDIEITTNGDTYTYTKLATIGDLWSYDYEFGSVTFNIGSEMYDSGSARITGFYWDNDDEGVLDW